jgi:hypothetical protein
MTHNISAVDSQLDQNTKILFWNYELGPFLAEVPPESPSCGHLRKTLFVPVVLFTSKPEMNGRCYVLGAIPKIAFAAF